MSVDLDERPRWVHRQGDLYLPIAVAAWMNETGYGFHYHLLANARGHEQAILAGLREQDSDDFVIGVIRGGRLVAMLWMHEVVDYDASALAEVAGQLGLRVAS